MSTPEHQAAGSYGGRPGDASVAASVPPSLGAGAPMSGAVPDPNPATSVPPVPQGDPAHLAHPTYPVPPVPKGPGVRPPFAAPPQRRQGGKLAAWLIGGGLVLLLCLVGGGIGVGGALVSAFHETEQEAQQVAGDYLEAVSEHRYDDAYAMTCRKVTEESFAEEVEDRYEDLVSYQLGGLTVLEDGRPVIVATLDSADGESTTIGLVMARERVPGSGEGPDAEYVFRVCGAVDQLPSVPR